MGFFTATIRRKILTSFSVVVILVAGVIVAAYYQLDLVRSLSRQITPSSSRLTALQDYALALSNLEGNLDRYFVIGGPQFKEAVLQDFEDMNSALKIAGLDLSPQMAPVYNELETGTQQLGSELDVLLNTDSAETSSRETNERIVSIFSNLETAKQLEQDLAQVTSVQLQETVSNQQALVSNIVVQGLVVGGIIILLVIVGSWVVTRSIAGPLANLTEAARQIEQGNLDIQVPVTTRDEIGQLAQTFNSMADQLRSILDTLENQVEERTRGMAIVANLNEQLAGILNVDRLLDEVVNQIKDNFDYYHVHIYLFDKDRENLVVAAGTGEAGETMKANHHSIRANAVSLVARTARTGIVVSIDNVREVADWLPNPLLPDTRSEVAVPIVVDAQVAGVLDVQEDEVAAFDEATFDLLRSVANQIAVAFRNVRQFEQVQSALAEAEAIQEQYLVQAWDTEKLRRFSGTQVDLQLAAIDADAVPTPVLNTPINFRQMTIGNLELEAADPQRDWSQEELAFVNAVVEQVAQTAENLRLFEETRERAGREVTIREITDKLRVAPNMEQLIAIATKELAGQLSATHAKLELGVKPQQHPVSSGGNGQGEGE